MTPCDCCQTVQTNWLNEWRLSIVSPCHSCDSYFEGLKNMLSLSFYRKSFYPHVSVDFFFCLNLCDTIFSSLWAKLMAVQELIVQACVWLPDGEWMWIRVRSGFTTTCFFLGTGNGEEAMRESWTWGWIGVPPRHLKLSVYNIQQKRKIILHIREDNISNVSCCFTETLLEVTVCKNTGHTKSLYWSERADWHNKITVNSEKSSKTFKHISQNWKDSVTEISFVLFSHNLFIS